MEDRKPLIGHLAALSTITLWGTTYVATKFLLEDFSPVDILIFRFVIGYIVLWMVHPHVFPMRQRKEEILIAGAGLCGVTLYFLFENTALTYTMASNVGVIVSIAPLFTAILAYFFLGGKKLTVQFLLGFVVAMTGIFLIGYNGSFILKLNPLGDILAVLAAGVFAIYSIIMRKISKFNINTLAVTRRMFFYGLLFMLPTLLWMDFSADLSRLADMTNLFSMLFLGVGASAICYATWNWAVGVIGPVKTTIYIYLVPVVTIIGAALFLGERFTWVSAVGAGLTLAGLYLSGWKRKVKVQEQQG
ncbi:MAG: DMT family transporter [Anaerolineaceae bacterium]|nr:DMT family transporter [Anaerolineaceae bacterium]